MYIYVCKFTMVTHTVFARSDAAATIYFIMQFCEASIREWHLLHSVLPVKTFVKGFKKSQFIRLTKNYDLVT